MTGPQASSGTGSGFMASCGKASDVNSLSRDGVGDLGQREPWPISAHPATLPVVGAGNDLQSAYDWGSSGCGGGISVAHGLSRAQARTEHQGRLYMPRAGTRSQRADWNSRRRVRARHGGRPARSTSVYLARSAGWRDGVGGRGMQEHGDATPSRWAGSVHGARTVLWYLAGGQEER